ncbi:metal-dependent hydrolase [Stenotrophomonas sp. DR822]|uniref:metal-dependent hydrolase n=1 Tax=Stenotrophomonas sp. DR822 TaxID=2871174 RepID=UPI001C97A44C|nr:metal-dependent hydrolase [Stenotrophomonas sp. DR822]QZN82572.1 metal-dependent hydrolase [Stenotrophomonas sp. DR822]
MDSLTQIVLGGAVAAAIAPPGHRRAALLAGAALGTLPDLDALWLGFAAADPVANMTDHRSFSHSLLVLPWVAALIWWLFKRFGNGRVAQSPLRWFWAIQLALVTHPVLDAFTVYGTQLWWPLQPHPAMGASVFIIDPGYTVWLLLGCVLAWFGRARPWVGKVLGVALLLSSAYLGWGLIAKAQVDRAAQQSLAAMGLGDAPRFSVPMPFNTLLWRVVAMTPSGYVVGDRSLVSDHGPMRFEGHPSNVQALREAAGIPAVRRLQWFNRGFMRAQVVQGRLVLSDLRMGLEPDYTFNFAVAEQVDGQWRAIMPEQLRVDYSSPAARADAGRRLSAMWQRIWHEPAAADGAAAHP